MLETMDYEKFRQELAGLASTDAAEFDGNKFRELGVRLCVILAQLFGDSLDRLKLWTRISDALRTSAAKVGDADAEHFISLCLSFVKAEDSRAASSDELLTLTMELASQDDGFRRQWIRYLSERVYTVVTFARAQWGDAKQAKAAAKSGAEPEIRRAA